MVAIEITPIRRNTLYTILLNFCTIDIDECSEDIDGCAQTCTNTNGSYSCSCRIGYRLAGDDHGCNGMPNL